MSTNPSTHDRDLEAALASARAARPTVSLEAGVFASYLAARATEAAGIRALCTDDLYLACACLHGNPGAFAALDPLITSAARFAVARLGAPSDLADEIAQELRTKLLVGPAPRLASYGGLGALSSWLAVAAMRAVISTLRARGREVTAADDAVLVAPVVSPELAKLQRGYAGDLRRAFVDALAAIEPDQRNLLRLYYLDGVGLDQLGVMYRVHASTISRRLAAAREYVLEATRARLSARLALPAADIESLLRALRDQVDVSVSALLAATCSDP